MDQVTTGTRAVLSVPFVYDAMQRVMGAHSMRRHLVDNIIRPVRGQSILDIGSGTSVILRYLPREITYFGYDISGDYVAHARKRFADRGTFIPRAFSAQELPSLPRFDIAMAVGLLHHLDDAEVDTLLRLLKAALKPDGRFISIDPCIVDSQNPIARFIIIRDRGRHVRSPLAYMRLAEPVFGRVQGHVNHRAWIPYTHWIMDCASRA